MRDAEARPSSTWKPGCRAIAALALGLVSLAGSACSLTNRIEACEGNGPGATTLNRRRDGFQNVAGPGALVPLPGGLFWLGFFSRVQDQAANEVRAVILGGDGEPLPGCDNASSQDETWMGGGAALTFHSLAVAPPAGPNRTGLVVAAHHGVGADARLVGTFFQSSGCRGLAASGRPFDIASGTMATAYLAHLAVVPMPGSSANDFLVIWNDEGRGAMRRVVRDQGGPEFTATRSAPKGEPAPLPLPATTLLGMHAVPVAPDRVAIAWVRARYEGIPNLRQQVFVGVLDPALDLVGGPIAIGDEEAGDMEMRGQSLVQLAWDGEILAVAWVRLEADGVRRVALALRDGQGRALAGGISPDGQPVPLSQGPGVAQDQHSLKALPQGGFSITWRERSIDAGATAQGRIKLALIGRDGQRIFNNRACAADEFVVLGHGGGDRTGPSHALGADGSLLVAWSQEGDVPDDTSGTAVRGALFSPAALFPRGQLPAPTGALSPAAPIADAGADAPAPIGGCMAAPGSVLPGLACGCSADCWGGALCREESFSGLPGGNCELPCEPSQAGACGAGASCVVANTRQCRATCNGPADCPPGRVCLREPGAPVGNCWPHCAADSECGSGRCNLYVGRCLAPGAPAPSGLGLEARCLTDEQCRSRLCVQGSCATFCKGSNPTCPEDGVCVPALGDYGACYLPCPTGTCPHGLTCAPNAGQTYCS